MWLLFDDHLASNFNSPPSFAPPAALDKSVWFFCGTSGMGGSRHLCHLPWPADLRAARTWLSAFLHANQAGVFRTKVSDGTLSPASFWMAFCIVFITSLWNNFSLNSNTLLSKHNSSAASIDSGEIYIYLNQKLWDIQAEWLACRKSRDPILNAVLLFSKTVCWEDAGSKIQFSLISVYKKMGLTTSKSWFGWKHGL